MGYSFFLIPPVQLIRTLLTLPLISVRGMDWQRSVLMQVISRLGLGFLRVSQSLDLGPASDPYLNNSLYSLSSQEFSSTNLRTKTEAKPPSTVRFLESLYVKLT